MKRRSLLLLPDLACLSELGAASDWNIDDQPGRLQVSLKGKPFTTMYYGKEWDKPF